MNGAHKGDGDDFFEKKNDLRVSGDDFFEKKNDLRACGDEFSEEQNDLRASGGDFSQDKSDHEGAHEGAPNFRRFNGPFKSPAIGRPPDLPAIRRTIQISGDWTPSPTNLRPLDGPFKSPPICKGGRAIIQQECGSANQLKFELFCLFFSLNF